MLIRKLEHKNIVKFIAACTDVSNLSILMELVEPWNLRQLLQDKSVQIGHQQKIQIVNGIIEGMDYLHSSSPVILHRDLKSSNILVNDKFEVKICDFGFARVRANNRTMTKCGTLVYQAPEVMRGKRYDEKSNVYSFGILLWEIETRKLAYEGIDVIGLQRQVLNGVRPEIRSGMNEQLSLMMRKCWDANAEERPRFRELLPPKNLGL